MVMKLGEPWRTRLISVTLVITALISIFQGYIQSISFLPPNWYVPIILGSLAVLLEITVDIKNIESYLDNLVQDAGYSETEVYRDYDRLFSDAIDTLRSTNGEIKLAHIRTDPPSSFNSEEVSTFHNEVIDWCRNHPATQAKRVITVSNKEMFKWAIELSKYSKNIGNFDVRVAEWESNFDMVNPAIFGDEDMYFALTLDTTETTRGIYVCDPEHIDVYERYFDNIWHNSTPVDEYIKDNIEEYSVEVNNY